MLSDEEVLWL